MDTIEMPLPTSAINPKVVLPNLSGRPVGSSEIRVSDGADASISSRNRDSASTSSRTDTKFPPPPLPNHHKKPDFQIPSKSGTPIPASSLPRRIHTNSSEPTSGMILSLPKQDPSKTLNPKRSVKLINILPPPNSSNKRPKMEQGIEDSEESARNLKRGRSEGKRERGERRAVRGGNLRAKCEIGVSNDSGLGGSSILGMYGLKIDAHDITKNTEDPPLKNLLEGSRPFYRHSSSSRDNKGKKSICSKEELMHSIRKAHSLLPVRVQNNKINNGSNNNKECDGGSKVKFSDKLAFLCKNSSEMNPKEVLDRLSLNQDQNLNSILISTNPNPSLPALNATSLPAFHWSTPPQSGAHKPSFDSVRLPWVRIGGNFTCCTEESDGKKSDCGLLDYLEELGKEDEKLKGLNCEKKEDASRRGEMSHETASVSGQTIEASKQGIDYSARVVQAAEILFEISRISNFQTIISQKQTNGAIKWPNSPSLKTMKPSKPLPPFNKHENSTSNNNTNTNTTNNNNSNVSNPFLSRNLDHSSPSRSVSSHSHHSSSKQLHKLPPTIDRKKHNNNHSNNNNSSKGSIKWPVPTFSTDPKQQSLKAGNDKRPHNSNNNNNYSSQARLERDYENQQRIRKATLTASLTGNPSHTNSNPGNSNPGNSNPGNSGPWDWKRNKRG